MAVKSYMAKICREVNNNDFQTCRGTEHYAKLWYVRELHERKEDEPFTSG